MQTHADQFKSRIDIEDVEMEEELESQELVETVKQTNE